jgi:multidrug efflux pump subunit AcrA (membrane-fusion protein)
MAPPYRDDERALRQRLAALDEQLREARDLSERRRSLDEARQRLEAERAELLERLASLEGAFALEDLRIASPCKADWDAMAGDDRVRFCDQCRKNVYNLGGMSRAEAEALVRGAEGSLCVRMYRRADGTVLTSDCPDGVARKRRRRLALVAGSGALATASALASVSTMRMGAMVPVRSAAIDEPTMGELIVEAPPAGTAERPGRDDDSTAPPADTGQSPGACNPGDPLRVDGPHEPGREDRRDAPARRPRPPHVRRPQQTP